MNIDFQKVLLFFLLFFSSYLSNSHLSFSADLKCPDAMGMTNGGSTGQVGPYDYRDPANKHALQMIEPYHFPPEVATLTKGHTAYLEGDIDYTLRAIPNHPRALQSLAELGLRKKSSTIPYLSFSIPCYFIRAKRYVPNDGMVDAVYAYYLAELNQKDLALVEAEEALKKAGNNPRIYYHTGLAYYYLGEYQKAQECSKQAKKFGSKAVGLETLLSQEASKNTLKK